MKRLFIAVITAGMVFASCGKNVEDKEESAGIVSDAQDGIKEKKRTCGVKTKYTVQFSTGTMAGTMGYCRHYR